MFTLSDQIKKVSILPKTKEELTDFLVNYGLSRSRIVLHKPGMSFTLDVKSTEYEPDILRQLVEFNLSNFHFDELTPAKLYIDDTDLYVRFDYIVPRPSFAEQMEEYEARMKRLEAQKKESDSKE